MTKVTPQLTYISLVSILLSSFSQAATPLCGTCLPRTVTLTPSDGTPGSITPKIQMLPNTAAGCRQMYISCPTPAGYAKSNMVFNDTPPPLRVGKNVKALVSCFKGSWRSTQGGSYIYVNSVRCFATK